MSQQAEATDIKKDMVPTGITIGTSVRTKFMRKFITKANMDGLYMLDMDILFEKVEAAAKFIERVGADRLIVCSGKEYADTPIEKFCEVVKCKRMYGRFMPGTLTNPSLPNYTEPKLVLVSDPQIDEQAVIEATNAGIPVIGISNTDNITSNLDIIIPANNRGRKALAAVYWLLARQVLIERGGSEPIKYEVEDFETKDAKESERR